MHLYDGTSYYVSLPPSFVYLYDARLVSFDVRCAFTSPSEDMYLYDGTTYRVFLALWFVHLYDTSLVCFDVRHALKSPS